MNHPRFRPLLAATGAAAAAAAIVLPATPAAAAQPPASCSGPTCGFSLYRQINIAGRSDTGGPTGSIPVSVTPPPCWYVPNTPDTSPRAMAEFQFGTDPNAVLDGAAGHPDWADLNNEILQHAHAHIDHKKNQLVFDGGQDAGEWYELAGSAGTGDPAVAKCMNVPLDKFFIFAPPNNPPPPPVPVPGHDIAQWLASKMTVPVPRLKLSPQKKGYVNLATYLWATWPKSLMTGVMNKYEIRGTLGDESVTVDAVPQKIIINKTGPGNSYTASPPCSLTPDAAGYIGSRAPFGNPPNNPPGTPPDCGILYSGPVQAPNVSVTVIWRRWWTGVNTPDGNGGPLTPPGQQDSRVTTLPVEEIQSINNGG